MKADNQLPRPEDVRALDMMIAEHDQALAEQEGPDLTTRSYAATVDEWLRFTAFVAMLDAAVRAPLAPESSGILLTARGLIDRTAYSLAFAISHAGEAIQRHRLSVRHG